ncbi:MAG TPA: phosphotransferase, partial [Acidimicrobiales bacterium]|nr:phosphotransferase [Acidimicrobiales bacterium]
RVEPVTRPDDFWKAWAAMESVPTEVGELTPDWLTQALRRHAPDGRVTSVSVVDSHSGTTGRVRLRLSYDGDRGELPDTVFCKLAPFDPRQRQFLRAVGIGAMEARFYAELAGDVPFLRIPRPWYAALGPEGDFVMVLEDLEAAGCRFPRPADPDVAERAASTVEELAHLHASAWESQRFSGDWSWVPDRAGFGGAHAKDPKVIAASGRFVSKAPELFGAQMPPVFGALCALYGRRTGEILDLWDEGPRTLVHGDPHSANLFTDRGRTGFFDWAMFSHSPGMRDVAYYCCNSLPTDVRRAVQDDLLALYRRALGDHGVALPADEARRQLRLFAVYSWVSATSTAAVGSRWQPSKRAVAAMARTTAAAEDLDSVGLLKELLR